MEEQLATENHKLQALSSELGTTFCNLMWEQEYATTGYIYTDYVIPIGKK
jgi:hypothetical protein